MACGSVKKVLVVDDESVVREGVAAFECFQPDLVITDISMPDMEGIEFLRILRKRKTDLPVVVMSGNVIGTKFLESARLFGATSILNKPFYVKDLLCAVQKNL